MRIIRNGYWQVNEATVLTCDRTNRQGVVHYINKVLLPEEPQGAQGGLHPRRHHHHVAIGGGEPQPAGPTGGTRVRWEERTVVSTATDERDRDLGEDDESEQTEGEDYAEPDPDLDHYDPDLDPQPEVYRGRHRPAPALMEQRYAEERVYAPPRQHLEQRTRVHHSAHRYLQS